MLLNVVRTAFLASSDSVEGLMSLKIVVAHFMIRPLRCLTEFVVVD